MQTIKIAKDFTDTPGGRYKKDGEFSGEEFREKFILPALEKIKPNEYIHIDLDGGYGYPTSFFKGAFLPPPIGYSRHQFLDKLHFKSDEEPLLIAEITFIILDGI